MENHLAREEIAAALETGEGRATRDSQTGGARTHYHRPAAGGRLGAAHGLHADVAGAADF